MCIIVYFPHKRNPAIDIPLLVYVASLISIQDEMLSTRVQAGVLIVPLLDMLDLGNFLIVDQLLSAFHWDYTLTSCREDSMPYDHRHIQRILPNPQEVYYLQYFLISSQLDFCFNTEIYF